MILVDSKLSICQNHALAEMITDFILSCVGKTVASKSKNIRFLTIDMYRHASGIMFSFGLPSKRKILTYCTKSREGPEGLLRSWS